MEALAHSPAWKRRREAEERANVLGGHATAAAAGHGSPGLGTSSSGESGPGSRGGQRGGGFGNFGGFGGGFGGGSAVAASPLEALLGARQAQQAQQRRGGPRGDHGSTGPPPGRPPPFSASQVRAGARVTMHVRTFKHASHQHK